ncbi:MAG: VOC family protein [Methanomassiliicoccales archaeon]|nr:VOC family protein [Methanomassiliicoccales archaeon]
MAKKGKVNYFEIPATKMERAQKFYADAFGWKISPIPGMEYSMLGASDQDKDGMSKEVGAISGGLGKKGGQLKHPVIHIQVDDVDKALEKIEDLGGKVLQKKTAMGEGMFYAYFEDTEGNVLGVWGSK